LRRYIPGKGLEAGRQPGQARSTKVRVGLPPRGRGARVGFLAQTGELAVTVRAKVYRRKLYDK